MPETYKSFGTILGSTANTTIYGGVTGTAIVNGINASNVSAQFTNQITVEVLKGSTAYSLITGGVIPVQSSFQILDSPVILETGNTISARAGLTTGIHVFVSVLEVT